MIEAYTNIFKNYATFSGRTSVGGYWWAMLANFLIGLVLTLLTKLVPIIGFLGSLYTLAACIPLLACAFRRLHDTGKSAWWLLIALIPLVGQIIVIVLLAMPSQPEDNAYGPAAQTI